MSNNFRRGQQVSWKWGRGCGHGTVVEKFSRRVQRTIRGEKIVRKGSDVNPAYLVDSEGGSQVLKLGSELEKA
ncbi:MAG: DUF2945 domain-containing protein [Sphingobium sp.]